MKKVRSTAVAVIKKEGKVLLIKRNTEPFKGYWSLPGGHIDFGETAKEAAIREAREETGLVFNPKFLGYRDELYPEVEWQAEVLIFYGDAKGNQKIDGEEISDIKWVELKKAMNMKLAFEHEKTLQMYKNTEEKNA